MLGLQVTSAFLRTDKPEKVTRLVQDGKIPVCVVGLGYVGLRLAVYFASAGAKVVGVDVEKAKVSLINRGICPVRDSSLADKFDSVVTNKGLRATTKIPRDFSVYIISVPTPLDEDHLPVLDHVTSASESVAKAMEKGCLVVLESTVYPGVTSKVVKGILSKVSRLEPGSDFSLAYCAERVDPGNLIHMPDNTPRVIGGIDDTSGRIAAAVYKSFVKADTIQVDDCEVAELVKLVENAYRDLNIAFANELALACQRMGFDIIEVIRAASTKWSFHAHFPGPGVGGSCIPVTPYYLMKGAKDAGAELPLLSMARRINEAMPGHTLHLVSDALNEIGKTVRGSKIAILGVSYKADIDDIRGSPGLAIGESLSKLGAQVVFYDPYASSNAVTGLVNRLDDAVRGAECILIATDHSLFRTLDLKHLKQIANDRVALVDGRGVVSPSLVRKMGFAYRGLGRAASSTVTAR